ncbi:18331_t:CDS:2, partial [Acaulospora morrowiae]
FPLYFNNIDGCEVQWRKTATNGITYFGAMSRIEGTKKKTMAELEDEIRLYTGGIDCSPVVYANHSDLSKHDDGIMIAGHCLDRNVDRMYDITKQLVLETNFDNVDKLKTIIYGNAASVMNSVVELGHNYARSFAASRIVPAM